LLPHALSYAGVEERHNFEAMARVLLNGNLMSRAAFDFKEWYGLGVPKATPAEIVDQLNKEVNAALDDPKMKAHLADLGGTPLPGSPAQFGKLIAEETEKWGKVIRATNIKAD
jgi:tripartite-type tricarboxylate transporter receptor subunit TctC